MADTPYAKSSVHTSLCDSQASEASESELCTVKMAGPTSCSTAQICLPCRKMSNCPLWALNSIPHSCGTLLEITRNYGLLKPQPQLRFPISKVSRQVRGLAGTRPGRLSSGFPVLVKARIQAKSELHVSKSQCRTLS